MTDQITTADLRPEIDFDQHSPEHAAHAVETFRDYRGRCPVAWSRNYGGFWLLTAYKDVFTALRDSKTFTSGRFENAEGKLDGGIAIPPLPYRLVPTETDLPEWEGPRMLLNRALSPTAVLAFRDRARNFTTLLIDRHVASGRMDLVLDLANPLPAIMTMELVGLPLEHWEKFAEPFHAYPSSRPGSPEHARAIEGIEWIYGQLSDLVNQRRGAPRDDLTSRILAAQRPEGRPYTHDEIVELLVQVVAGGVDTTTSLTANAFWHLHTCHDDRRRLIEDPSLFKPATEEFLRFYTPIQNEGRTASRDCSIGGQDIAAGERVLLSLASANRDGTEFEDADRFVIDRQHNLHAAFGLGMHRCVGSHFARMLFEIMLFAVLDRIPDYEVIEAGAERYPVISAVNGWATMPVRFTPGAAKGADLTLPC